MSRPALSRRGLLGAAGGLGLSAALGVSGQAVAAPAHDKAARKPSPDGRYPVVPLVKESWTLGVAQARQAGGTVRIMSALGAGTTVRVLLPCTDQPPVRLDGTSPSEALEPGEPMSILLVDDDDDHRTVIATGLEALGHRVVQAPDGISALAMLERDCAEVLVSDYAMPDMNGAELAAEVHRRWPQLPIVFASGLADTEAIEAAVGRGARILRKPFRIDALVAAVRQAVKAA